MMMTVTIEVSVDKCLSGFDEIDLQQFVATLAGVEYDDVEMSVGYDD